MFINRYSFAKKCFLSWTLVSFLPALLVIIHLIKYNRGLSEDIHVLLFVVLGYVAIWHIHKLELPSKSVGKLNKVYIIIMIVLVSLGIANLLSASAYDAWGSRDFGGVIFILFNFVLLIASGIFMFFNLSYFLFKIFQTSSNYFIKYGILMAFIYGVFYLWPRIGWLL